MPFQRADCKDTERAQAFTVIRKRSASGGLIRFMSESLSHRQSGCGVWLGSKSVEVG